MFTLLNISKQSTHLAIRITSPDGNRTELTIGPLISKRNPEELVPERQFELMNGYLDYKGKDFKQMLWMAILDAQYAVEESTFYKGISNPPTEPIKAILDLFDMDDIVHYIRDIHKVKPPVNLKAEFDQQIESDGLGTRVQTYLQRDYYELAALTIPMKAIIGLLGQYAIRKGTSIAPIHKEYVLYSIFSSHNITKYPAVNKIRDWAKILIDLTIQTNDAALVTVIEKQIPSSELSNYILSVVLIQKVTMAAIVTDDHNRNVITRIYNYITNKLRAKGGASNKIRDKKPLADTDSTTGDKESIVESYRVVSNTTIGIETELCWYTRKMDLLIRDMGLDINMSLLEDAVAHCQCFRQIPVCRQQVILAGYVFKPILDPRSLDYVDIDGIINVLSLSFAILWSFGHREVAMLMLAKPIISTEEDIDINATPNIRLEPELKKKLVEIYPYEKQVNAKKTISVVEESITALTYEVFKYRWLPNAPKQCLEELYGNSPAIVLTPNFKNHLAKMIIDLEERRNDATTSTGS